MIRQDWANHLIYGLIAFILGAALAVAAGLGDHRHTAGMLATLAAALGKEGADWLSNRRAIKAGTTPTHSVDWWDGYFTLAGGTLGAAASVVGAW